MPGDITLCHGAECQLKEHCIRFTTKVYGRRNFFATIPCDSSLSRCEYYTDDRPNKIQVSLYAYHLWEKEGCQNGKDGEYWFRAEKELLQINRNG